MEIDIEVQWICTDIIFLLHEAQHVAGQSAVYMHAAENIMYRTAVCTPVHLRSSRTAASSELDKPG